MAWRTVVAGLAAASFCAGAALADADKGAAPGRSAAGSGPAAEALDEAHRANISQLFKTYVMPRFQVLADDRLDPDLREAAESMQAEHLPRVRALMERWTLEELQQPNPHRAPYRMVARLVNEFALWGRDSDGTAYDAALAEALKSPGMCRPPGPKSGELVLRMARLRSLPESLRRDAVQAERSLLARWGQTRQVNGSEPLAAEEMLLQLRTTGRPPARALPPALAYNYLGDDADTRQDPRLAEAPLRCALHQWAGADPAQFRAATAMQAADFFAGSRLEAAGPSDDEDAYPKLAAYFGARGLITVQAEVNAQGRVVRARVAKRAVQVPGIRDARPFAHEGVLELASLARAREMDWAAAAPKEGLATVEREFQWSLKWE